MNIVETFLEQERKAVLLRGFGIRGFAEDNHITGSWAYTVGLNIPGTGPSVLYMRAGIEIGIIEDLMNDLGRHLQKYGVMNGAVFQDECYENVKTGKRIRVRIRRIGDEQFADMQQKFGTPVESQDSQATPFWVFITDENDRFPDTPGYIDFFQTGLPANHVDKPTEKSEE